MKNQIEYKGFYAQIMEAPRLEGDKVFDLPPGQALDIYSAGEFLKWPEGWMRGPGVYICPVKPNKGLWFNWTANDSANTAIIPTVKGCNPITGLQTSGFHLERYLETCPKHGCAFLDGLFCPECQYKWPSQNYVAGPPLWWDGFRSSNGQVRQFFFSEDELRDIASYKIGKENTVPAFGFAFYTTKERRVINNSSTFSFIHDNLYIPEPPRIWNNTTWGVYTGNATGTSSLGVLNAYNKTDDIAPRYTYGDKSILSSAALNERSTSAHYCCSANFSEPVKSVAIGAGAKIRQDLIADTFPLESWKNLPDAVVTLYFMFEEQFQELKAGGLVNTEPVSESMLAGLPVG